MMTFRQYLEEGINDKGIFKAIFVTGIPGSGKSYTIDRISSGSIEPRIVNTDHVTEFLAKKFGMRSKIENWPFFSDQSKQLTKKKLFNYMNGMLPLFIDGTSNNTGAVLGRAGLLESIGYDVGMIFINTNLEVAQQRAVSRSDEVPRDVSPEFIEQVNSLADENKQYFAGKFKFFKEHNNTGELDDAAILELYRKVSGFFEGPIENPIGKRTYAELMEKKEKLLVPTIVEAEVLTRKLDSWYARGK